MAHGFLPWPDPRLRQPAEPAKAVDEAARKTWDDMLAAMYGMPGIGLAAPQIGVMRCLAVVDCSPEGDAPIRFADPRLIHTSEDTALHAEASPNLIGISAEIRRPVTVRVAYLDETGAETERELTGLWARSIQHQIDHLQGRVFVDRLPPVKRRMLLARYAKLARKASR